jgi:hypothetical protein
MEQPTPAGTRPRAGSSSGVSRSPRAASKVRLRRKCVVLSAFFASLRPRPVARNGLSSRSGRPNPGDPSDAGPPVPLGVTWKESGIAACLPIASAPIFLFALALFKGAAAHKLVPRVTNVARDREFEADRRLLGERGRGEGAGRRPHFPAYALPPQGRDVASVAAVPEPQAGSACCPSR